MGGVVRMKDVFFTALFWDLGLYGNRTRDDNEIYVSVWGNLTFIAVTDETGSSSLENQGFTFRVCTFNHLVCLSAARAKWNNIYVLPMT